MKNLSSSGLLGVLVCVSIIFASLGHAQERATSIQRAKPVTPVARSLIVIPADQITRQAPPPPVQPGEKPVARGSFSSASGQQPSPSLGLQSVPAGPAKFTLTPKQPANYERGYLKYMYPRLVFLGESQAYAKYSSEHNLGAQLYALHVQKGKKYLLEIEVACPNNARIVHTINGGGAAYHNGTGYGNRTTISSIVQPAETGWIQGKLEGDSQKEPAEWKFYSLRLTEM